jgi:hypothetical protein
MGETPLTPIEKLLKATGQKRLASVRGQTTLPAGTREALQKEVERTYRTSSQTNILQWAGAKLMWPRLAWAAAFSLVILAMGILFYRPYQDRTLEVMVRNDPTKAAQTVVPTEPASTPLALSVPAPQQSPGVALPPSLERPAGESKIEFAAKTEMLFSPPADSPPQPVRTAMLPAIVASNTVAANHALADARSAVPVSVQQSGPQTPFYFQQITSEARYRRNLNSPVPPRVMQQFRVEQEGNQVRIIDEDGSTYAGQINPNPARYMVAETTSKAARATDTVLNVAPRPAASAVVPSGWVPLYEIQAEGMNKTLNQRVSVQASLLHQTNQADPATLKRAGAAAQTLGGGQTKRLLGTVIIAETNRMRLEAVTP